MARPQSGQRPAELHALAVEQYNLGTPARALRTLRRALKALELAPDTLAPQERAAVTARIWISIALNESEMRSVEHGFAALITAEQHAVAAADPAVTVLLHCQRGLIELRGGNAARAVASLDEAVALIEHAEPRDQANILLNRGTVAMMDGRLAAARDDLARAVAIARAAGLSVEEFKTLHNSAYVEFLAGDLPQALRLMDESGRAEVGRGEWGVALLDRARVLAEAGLTREADDALARAADILRRDRMTQDLAETLLERARCALVLGDVAAVRRFAGLARSGFRRRGNDRWRRVAELVLLSGDLAAGRPGSRLIGPALRVRDEFEAERLRVPARSATLTVAEVYLSAGRVDQAAATVAGLSAADRRGPITSRLHDHYVRAAIEAARQDRAAATRWIRRGMDDLAAYQASFGSIDLRTAAAVHGRRLAELDISVALEGARADAVFAAAERARAVSSRLAPVRPPDDPVAAELLAELRQTVEALRAVEQDRAASERLLARRVELERRIVARTWTVSGSGAAVRAATVAEVRARLAERGRSMIMYVQADGGLWAVTVGARVELRPLGPAAPVIEAVRRVRADLDVLAQDRLPAPLRAAVRASLQRSLAGVDGALVAPLRLHAEPLAIVSTGVLGQLPWASLPSLRGVSIVVAPSATKWLTSSERRAPERRTPGAGRLTVAVAGPDLDRAEHEAGAVGAAWPGSQVLTGAGATRAQFTAAMARAEVLHVAAHGVHQPENPLFSSLRMVDGPVFAHELDRSELAPEHVVLSACEVGLATVRPGDEALGLASVLLHLGTRNVVAGVARVSDVLAEQTMAIYHAGLAAGTDSAAALASALLEVDSDVVPPFVAFGASWTP